MKKKKKYFITSLQINHIQMVGVNMHESLQNVIQGLVDSSQLANHSGLASDGESDDALGGPDFLHPRVSSQLLQLVQGGQRQVLHQQQLPDPGSHLRL